MADNGIWSSRIPRDPVLLGTAGAVRHALPQLLSDRFFVLNGDSYCPADTKRLEAAHLARGARATLWCVRMDECNRYGFVEIGLDGAVRTFCEKMLQKRAGAVSAGVYMLEREVVRTIPEGCRFSLETDFFPALIGRGLYAVVGDNPFFDFGTPEAYASVDNFFAANIQR